MRAAHGPRLGHTQGHVSVSLQATRSVARPALVLDSPHVAAKAPAEPATDQVVNPMPAPEAQEPSASAAAVPALISASRPRRSLKPKRRTRQVSELPPDTDAWPPELLYLQQLQQMLEGLEQELDRAAAKRPGVSTADRCGCSTSPASCMNQPSSSSSFTGLSQVPHTCNSKSPPWVRSCCCMCCIMPTQHQLQPLQVQQTSKQVTSTRTLLVT
jgi:hypothetical protein